VALLRVNATMQFVLCRMVNGRMCQSNATQLWCEDEGMNCCGVDPGVTGWSVAGKWQDRKIGCELFGS